MKNTDQIRFKGFFYHHTLNDTPSQDDFSRHCHNMYEIVYIRQGEGRFLVEGSQYDIRPGAILIFRPREFHCLNISENKTYERMVVHFDESIVFEQHEMLLDLFNNRELGSNNLFDASQSTLLAVFNRFLTCSELTEPEIEIMAKLILNQILVQLHHEFLPTERINPNEKLINRIVSYINENIASPLHLETLAENFYISKYHLGHMFKYYTGMPVMEYIIRKRLMMAQQLMNGGTPASAAATLSGFNDYSSFYRAYIKYIGVKPSDEVQK